MRSDASMDCSGDPSLNTRRSASDRNRLRSCATMATLAAAQHPAPAPIHFHGHRRGVRRVVALRCRERRAEAHRRAVWLGRTARDIADWSAVERAEGAM